MNSFISMSVVLAATGRVVELFDSASPSRGAPLDVVVPRLRRGPVIVRDGIRGWSSLAAG